MTAMKRCKGIYVVVFIVADKTVVISDNDSYCYPSKKSNVYR